MGRTPLDEATRPPGLEQVGVALCASTKALCSVDTEPLSPPLSHEPIVVLELSVPRTKGTKGRAGAFPAVFPSGANASECHGSLCRHHRAPPELVADIGGLITDQIPEGEGWGQSCVHGINAMQTRACVSDRGALDPSWPHSRAEEFRGPSRPALEKMSSPVSAVEPLRVRGLDRQHDSRDRHRTPLNGQMGMVVHEIGV